LDLSLLRKLLSIMKPQLELNKQKLMPEYNNKILASLFD
jgi:hypothetical protein